MTATRHLDGKLVEVRGYKWPRRPQSVAVAAFIGEDTFGRWLGVAAGNPWWSADRSRSGVFTRPLVKLVPDGTFWTACFHPVEPLVDVDIVMPVRWLDHALEEVDLEVDVLRYADGHVQVRDRDEFDRVRTEWSMPDGIVRQIETACEYVHRLLEAGTEPFGNAGREWLSRFMSRTDSVG